MSKLSPGSASTTFGRFPHQPSWSFSSSGSSILSITRVLQLLLITRVLQLLIITRVPLQRSRSARLRFMHIVQGDLCRLLLQPPGSVAIARLAWKPLLGSWPYCWRAERTPPAGSSNGRLCHSSLSRGHLLPERGHLGVHVTIGRPKLSIGRPIYLGHIYV